MAPPENDDDDPVPPGLALSLDETFRVLEALEDSLDALRRAQIEPGLQHEVVTIIRLLHGRLGLDEGCPMTRGEILSPPEAARRLGVRTAVVIQAMYEKRLPRVRLDNGTLGVPAEALEGFHTEVTAGA